MAEALPNWVYDLVNQLDEQTSHPRLLFESGAFEGTAPYDWCPCAALERVPEDVKERARAIAAYRRESEKDKEPTE
jgi:hypothetical protein